MTRLQLALDLTDLERARSIARSCAPSVDMVEIGTILCVEAGLEAVRAVRADLPDASIVADLRIARAGGKIAKLAFAAGADAVTCVADAPQETIAAAVKAAREAGGTVQLELDESWSCAEAASWRELGIAEVVCHATAEIGALGGGHWGAGARARIEEVARTGLKAIAAGSIDLDNLAAVAVMPVATIVCGRAIWDHPDPAAAAAAAAAAIS